MKRPVRIEGDVAYVTLSKGHVVTIDVEDVPLVEGFNWTSVVAKYTVYGARTDYSGPKSRSISMHREIMDAPPGLEVDHIDGNGLNNRRSNLRVVTRAQNAWNRRKASYNKSGFKGVTLDKPTGKWRAQITLNRKQRFLGHYDTIAEAAAVYAKASAELHGEFGRVA
jgi:hypothetical protein